MTQPPELTEIVVELRHMRADIADVKQALIGSDKRSGLILDVDRLKRARSVHNAVLWFFFTSLVGTALTAIASMLTN